MKSTRALPFAAKPLAALPLVALTACLMAAASLQAQTVYRIVGPDGRVTFSDKPPQEAAARVTPATSASASPTPPPGPAASALPYALRQAMGQYPVTLYAGADCVPCDSGRSLLKARGIPFAEKSISTNEDIEALKRMSGDTSLPVLTLGGQKIKGLSESQWTQYLDAAGYPQKSALPASYRFSAATPLVALQKLAEPSTDKPQTKPDSRPAGPASEAPGSALNPNNPAGISF